jgi:hypothetical protein
MPVGNLFEDIHAEPFTKLHDALLMAGCCAVGIVFSVLRRRRWREAPEVVCWIVRQSCVCLSVAWRGEIRVVQILVQRMQAAKQDGLMHLHHSHECGSLIDAVASHFTIHYSLFTITRFAFLKLVSAFCLCRHSSPGIRRVNIRRESSLLFNWASSPVFPLSFKPMKNTL